jgi:hypothetical protein
MTHFEPDLISATEHRAAMETGSRAGGGGPFQVRIKGKELNFIRVALAKGKRVFTKPGNFHK